MQKGTINIQTENIFPIIKKFLYSDTEIFVRELVSNAVDASQKLKTISAAGEYKGNVDNLKVEVILDKENKTITVRDNGIGMTSEEVHKYINEIAFSGATEFAEKYKDKDANSIIGHFGLGFYSSFMVSDKVQIQTLSYKEGSKGVQWESDGSPEYSIGEIEKRQLEQILLCLLEKILLNFLKKLVYRQYLINTVSFTCRYCFGEKQNL